MVIHIVAWNFASSIDEEEKATLFEKIKYEMEKLAIIDGCIDIEVHSCLKTSTKDITLIGKYESVDALQAYATHPSHIEAKNQFVDVLVDREAIDYYID